MQEETVEQALKRFISAKIGATPVGDDGKTPYHRRPPVADRHANRRAFFSYGFAPYAMARRRTDPQQRSRIAFVLGVRSTLN